MSLPPQHASMFPKFPNIMPVETYFGAHSASHIATSVDTVQFGRRKKSKAFEPHVNYAQFGLSVSEIKAYEETEQQWHKLLNGLEPSQAKQLLDRINRISGVMTFSFNLPTLRQGSLAKLLSEDTRFLNLSGSRWLLNKAARWAEREIFGIRDAKTSVYLGAGVIPLHFAPVLFYNETIDERSPAVAQSLGNFDILSHETIHILHTLKKLMHKSRAISPEAKAYRRIYDAVALNATRTSETRTPAPDIGATVRTACNGLSPKALKTCKESLISEAVAHQLQAELIQKAAAGTTGDAQTELQTEADETQRTSEGFCTAVRVLNEYL